MAEGEAKGRAEGELFGQVKGRAAAIISLLEHRGILVPSTTQQRVMACTDLARLDLWFRRAITAHSHEETFSP